MSGPVDLTSIEAILTRRQRAKAEITRLEEEVRVLDERIKAAWGDAEEATVGGQPAGTWREVTSTRLNQSAAKSYLSGRGVLDDFMETSSSRVFRLTWEPPEQEVPVAVQASGYDDQESRF